MVIQDEPGVFQFYFRKPLAIFAETHYDRFDLTFRPVRQVSLSDL